MGWIFLWNTHVSQTEDITVLIIDIYDSVKTKNNSPHDREERVISILVSILLFLAFVYKFQLQ